MKADKLKIEDRNIEVNGKKVFLNDVSFENQDLAEYLSESDDKLASLVNIIELGVKTMNSLKNSIERDFTQKTFQSIAVEMKKNLSDSIENIGDEFEKYFNEDGELIKELSENKYEVVGLEYNLSKFEAVDRKGIVRRPHFPIPPQADMEVPDSPSDLILNSLT